MSRSFARLPVSLRLLWLTLALFVLVVQPALSLAAQAHETLHWLQGTGLSHSAHHLHDGHGAAHGHASTALSVASAPGIEPATVLDSALGLATAAESGAAEFESESVFSRLLHASPCCVHSATVPSIELMPLSLAPIAQPFAEGARLRADTALPRALRPPIAG
jgi:hypothetical protein